MFNSVAVLLALSCDDVYSIVVAHRIRSSVLVLTILDNDTTILPILHSPEIECKYEF